jgi:hypothetical protein
MNPGDVFLLVIAFLLMLTLFLLEPGRVYDLVVNPTAGLILIIIVVEYLVLKSMDRTRVFRMENRRLVDRRRRDRVILRAAREVIEDGLAVPDAAEPEAARRRWEERARKALEQINEGL